MLKIEEYLRIIIVFFERYWRVVLINIEIGRKIIIIFVFKKIRR
jgi:hypothetical protein